MTRFVVCLLFGALAADLGLYLYGRGNHELGWQADEITREGLERELEVCQSRLEAAAERPDELKIRSTEETIEAQASRLPGLRDQLAEMKQRVAERRRELGLLKENRAREVRRQAIGKKFPVFTTLDGRSYEQAKIVSIDLDGVTVRHVHGSAKIHLVDLTPEQRVLFGWEEAVPPMVESGETTRSSNDAPSANPERSGDDRNFSPHRNNISFQPYANHGAADSSAAHEASDSKSTASREPSPDAPFHSDSLITP